ncbi:hypothetical protein [Streptomyces huiliensis]|nr:hypothetical protein [Streptomyces huiliensis]MBZ4320105.1 hypothetical protein [Streptomyces huiliensis]
MAAALVVRLVRPVVGRPHCHRHAASGDGPAAASGNAPGPWPSCRPTD